VTTVFSRPFFKSSSTISRMKSVAMKCGSVHFSPPMLFLLSLLFAQTIAPPACDPEKFITKAYQDVLGQPIDGAGKAHWLEQMKNGATRTQVANQLLRSAEHSNARVQNMFNAYLHRPAGGELTFYSSMLQHGTPVEDVRSAILASPEYFNARAGATDAG